MKYSKYIGLIYTGLVAFFLGIAISSPAYAYVDPGTGSYVLQILTAGVLAAAFLVKSSWNNIKKTFVKLFDWRKNNAG